MVSWALLAEHFAALAILWAFTMLAGFALLPLLRARLGLAGVPLFGVVYWTCALYLLPFQGGLDIAAGLALVLAGVQTARWVREGAGRPIWTRPSWSMAILLVGSLPYTTTLFFHYVPFGMDGSMHATAAAAIGRAGGLPDSHAPYLPELALPPMNLGLPAVAGVAMRFGGEPAAVMLAAHHLTFTLLILATYLLLRTWIGRTPAALIAVASTWMARGTQASLGWGGFPTVMSVAVGLLAARLLLEQSRSANWRTALVTGASIAAIPLIHGVGGGTWLYCVAPWVALATFLTARDRWATVRGFALSGATAASVLLAYRAAGMPDVTADDLEWTRQWQRQAAPLGENVLVGAIDFIRKDSGSVIVLAGWAALGVLALRRQWLAAGLLAAAWLTLTLVVANGQWWILPASFLLYPERAIYWAAPMSAVGLALVWRSIYVPSSPPAFGFAIPVRRTFLSVRAWTDRNVRPTSRKVFFAACVVAVLGCAGYFQNQFYQKIVREEFVNVDGWQALVWAREHLNPSHDFVQAPYNSTGSFLPAVASIGCTGSHHHHFNLRQAQAVYAARTATHVLLDHRLAPQTETPAGTVVFRNPSITIIELSKHGSKRENP